MNKVLNFNAVGFICHFLCGFAFLKCPVSEIVNSSVVGRIMAPKDDYGLIPKACEYVILHGEGELRLQVEVELRVLIS